MSVSIGHNADLCAGGTSCAGPSGDGQSPSCRRPARPPGSRTCSASARQHPREVLYEFDSIRFDANLAIIDADEVPVVDAQHVRRDLKLVRLLHASNRHKVHPVLVCRPSTDVELEVAAILPP